MTVNNSNFKLQEWNSPCFTGDHLFPRPFLGLVFSWWELHNSAVMARAVLLYTRRRSGPGRVSAVLHPSSAAHGGYRGMWGHYTEPKTLTPYANCTGRSRPYAPGEEVKKARVSFSCCDRLSFFIPSEPVPVLLGGLQVFCDTNGTTPQKDLFTEEIQ